MTFLAAALVLTALVTALWLTKDWGASPWRWLLPLQLALILAIGSLAYAGKLPRWMTGLPWIDKVFHVLLAGGAAWLLHLWLGGRRWPGRVPVAITLMFAVATVDELTQGLSPTRTLDWLDWFANLLGLGIAWWLAPRSADSDQTGSHWRSNRV